MWKTIFLGDWHPVLRDPLDLFRLSFPIGARIFAVQGGWDAAVRLFLPGLAVFAVRAMTDAFPAPCACAAQRACTGSDSSHSHPSTRPHLAADADATTARARDFQRVGGPFRSSGQVG